jgi:hypothetical protein
MPEPTLRSRDRLRGNHRRVQLRRRRLGRDLVTPQNLEDFALRLKRDQGRRARLAAAQIETSVVPGAPVSPVKTPSVSGP